MTFTESPYSFSNRLLFFLCCILMVLTSCAPSVSNDALIPDATTEEWTDFIPDEYVLLDSVSGDLNKDEYKDLLLLLKKPTEDATLHDMDYLEFRPLLILLGQKEERWKRVARNDKTVYCYQCGGIMGDPYTNMIIKDGYFSIEHYGGSAWRWTKIVTYKYDPTKDNWFLHRVGGDSFHASDPENITHHMKTKKDFGIVAFESFDIYENDGY